MANNVDYRFKCNNVDSTFITPVAMTHGGNGPWLWCRLRFLRWDAEQKQIQNPQITMELEIEEQDLYQLKSFFTTKETVIRMRNPHKE